MKRTTAQQTIAQIRELLKNVERTPVDPVAERKKAKARDDNINNAQRFYKKSKRESDPRKYNSLAKKIRDAVDPVIYSRKHMGKLEEERRLISGTRTYNNPVPEGLNSRLARAKRRYESFRDLPADGTYKVDGAPNYAKGSQAVGMVAAIDYTTFRTKHGKKEKYRHQFLEQCAPILMRSGDGNYWSNNGNFRFTYRGFVDNKSGRNHSKAGHPPFKTALVVGYLDTLHLDVNGKPKKLSFAGKKVLLLVSESGYNFFTMPEPR